MLFSALSQPFPAPRAKDLREHRTTHHVGEKALGRGVRGNASAMAAAAHVTSAKTPRAFSEDTAIALDGVAAADGRSNEQLSLCTPTVEKAEDEIIKASNTFGSVSRSLGRPKPVNGRVYSLFIHNLTSRNFELKGPQKAAFRKVPEGRLLSLRCSVPPTRSPAPAVAASLAEALAPHADPNAQAIAIASFSACPSRGDVLEFTLSFIDSIPTCDDGFTVRVNAHQKSPLRSDVVVVGLDLNVTSTLEEVPSLLVEPPQGYAETALGVYSKPERCEEFRVGALQPGEEVVQAPGNRSRDGRWLQIVSPMQGWLQAETRDGRRLLNPSDKRPHLRQTVVVRTRLRGSGAAEPTPESTSHLWPLVPERRDSPRAPQVCDRVSPGACQLSRDDERSGEREYLVARSREASRLDRHNSELEGVSLFGRRTRRAQIGVL